MTGVTAALSCLLDCLPPLFRGFCAYMRFTAERTVSKHTLYQRYQRVMYDEVLEFFTKGGVAEHTLPSYSGFRKSRRYKRFRRASNGIFGGVGSDSKIAAPMFLVDYTRILEVLPPTALGGTPGLACGWALGVAVGLGCPQRPWSTTSRH